MQLFYFSTDDRAATNWTLTTANWSEQLESATNGMLCMFTAETQYNQSQAEYTHAPEQPADDKEHISAALMSVL